jgi:hypothetical protein
MHEQPPTPDKRFAGRPVVWLSAIIAAQAKSTHEDYLKKQKRSIEYAGRGIIESRTLRFTFLKGLCPGRSAMSRVLQDA